MFVVGRSGNKSLDELVEADPDPTRKENTAGKEAGKREQRKKKARTSSCNGRREGEGALGGNRLRMEGFGVLVSCYPVCYEEDSRGRGGKQKSVLETEVSTMRTNETRSEEKECVSRPFFLPLSLSFSQSTHKSKIYEKNIRPREKSLSRLLDRTFCVSPQADGKKKTCVHISLFVNTRAVYRMISN